jgi:hypothetical protein
MHTEEQIRYAIDVMVEELEKIDPRHLGRARSERATSAESIRLG